ncbi:hypothetical protein H0O02_03410 [Candidatus Micrarchaeota archaeon]|nr:hypothetical protein [Candidatus Micrarchaeota archaeon]
MMTRMHTAFRTEGKDAHHVPRQVIAVKSKFACCKPEDIMGKKGAHPEKQSVVDENGIDETKLSPKMRKIYRQFIELKAKHKISVHVDEDDVRRLRGRPEKQIVIDETKLSPEMREIWRRFLKMEAEYKVRVHVDEDDVRRLGSLLSRVVLKA